MAKRVKGPAPRGVHYIAEWRQFRKLTQQALADRMGTSNATVSRVENYDSAYTQDFLEACAHALDCSPSDLIKGPPSENDEVSEAIKKLNSQQLRQALRFINAIIEDENQSIPSTKPFKPSKKAAPHV